MVGAAVQGTLMKQRVKIPAPLIDLQENILYVLDDVFDFLKGKFARIRPVEVVKVERGDRKAGVRYMRRGRRYYNNKLYARAHRNFRRAVRADESYGLAHYYLGLACYKMDLPDAARKNWTRATEVEPGSEAAEKARAKLDNPTLKRLNSVKGHADDLEE